jgi:hypothetical protein
MNNCFLQHNHSTWSSIPTFQRNLLPASSGTWRQRLTTQCQIPHGHNLTHFVFCLICVSSPLLFLFWFHLQKGKVNPRKGQEGREVEQRYCSTLSLTLVLNVGGWSMLQTENFTPRERPSTHCIWGWMGPGPVWMGVTNLAPTGIQSIDHPVYSKSLYWLCYPGPHTHNTTFYTTHSSCKLFYSLGSHTAILFFSI